MKKVFLFLFFIEVLEFFMRISKPEDTLQQYTGKYKFPEGSAVTEVVVTLENGVLTGSSASGSSELKKMQGDTFEVVAYSGTAVLRDR